MSRGDKVRTGTDDPRGLGIIKCRICDEPVRDHDIGRCPRATDQTVFYGPAKQPRREVRMDDDEATE